MAKRERRECSEKGRQKRINERSSLIKALGREHRGIISRFFGSINITDARIDAKISISDDKRRATRRETRGTEDTRVRIVDDASKDRARFARY